MTVLVIIAVAFVLAVLMTPRRRYCADPNNNR
jgi:hypothetical protein